MTYINFTPPTQYGWVCPKCGRVNAPSVVSCYCWMEAQAQKAAPATVDLTPKVIWAKDTSTTTPHAGGTDA